MSAARDVILIGGGHNGLTAAALLAKAGRRVLVLERAALVGGMAAADEFHPGFRSPGLHHDTTGVSRQVVADLQLERHGLALRAHAPDVLGLDSGLVLRGDPSADARDLAEYRAFLDRSRRVLEPLLLGPPLDLLDLGRGQTLQVLRRGLALRRLGAAAMMELLRVPPMPVADFLGEWFDNPGLCALLALPAIAGSFAGPRSPGTTLNLLRLESAAGPGVVGGGPSLASALEAAARAAGVEIRTGAEVRAIVVEAGSVRGVVLANGERIDAGTVAASCDPKRLLGLLPHGALPLRDVERVERLRTRGTTAQVLLALARPPRFAARADETFELGRTGAVPDDLERAFDAVKYRKIAEEPVLEVHVPTVSNPGLAPSGAAVASVHVHFVPHAPDGGWSDADRERLGDLVVSLLEQRAPGIAATVVGRSVRTPADLETRYAVSGGQIHHGEHALDQLLVRPAPGFARYATPIAGLYLCGSGSHPGGGLTCRPGALAAAAILAK